MATKKKSGQANRSQVVATFKHPVTVEIVAPVFVPLASANTQDVQKLSKGTHKIEIGFLEGGCCPKLVRAVIRKGIVTRLEVEPCDDSERVMPEAMSKEISQIVAQARRKVEQDPWKPVPVGEFITAIASQFPPRAGWGAGCFYICIWHYCLFCCFVGPVGCWIERRKPDVIM